MRSTKLSALNSLVTKAILTPEVSITAQAANDSRLIGFIIIIIDHRADKGQECRSYTFHIDPDTDTFFCGNDDKMYYECIEHLRAVLNDETNDCLYEMEVRKKHEYALRINK